VIVRTGIAVLFGMWLPSAALIAVLCLGSCSSSGDDPCTSCTAGAGAPCVHCNATYQEELATCSNVPAGTFCAGDCDGYDIVAYGIFPGPFTACFYDRSSGRLVAGRLSTDEGLIARCGGNTPTQCSNSCSATPPQCLPDGGPIDAAGDGSVE